MNSAVAKGNKIGLRNWKFRTAGYEKIVLFINFIILNLHVMGQTRKAKNFEIIAWNNAVSLISNKGMKFFEPSRIVVVDRSINIFLYDLTDNETVVIPEYPLDYFSRTGFPCFIYKNATLLELDIKQHKLPVPNEFRSVLEFEKSELLAINTSYIKYAAWVDEILGTKYSSSITLEQLRSGYSLLSKRREDYSFEKLVLAFSIVVSKFILNQENGSFEIFFKNQGYVALVIPCVRIEESVINTYETLRFFDLNKDFDQFLTRAYLNAKPRLERFNNLSTSEYFRKLQNLEFLKKD